MRFFDYFSFPSIHADRLTTPRFASILATTGPGRVICNFILGTPFFRPDPGRFPPCFFIMILFPLDSPEDG